MKKAKERVIKNQRCRLFYKGNFWISEDGKVVEVEKTEKIGYSFVTTIKPVTIQVDSSGDRYVIISGRKFLLKEAVYTCFQYWPKDGKDYEVNFIDGNKSNLHYKNLNLKLKTYVPPTVTTELKVKFKNGLTVTKDGEVFQGRQQQSIHDEIYDSDTATMACIDPFVQDPSRIQGRLCIDDLMDAAGYVHGDKRVLKYPVILHRDNNPNNCKSDNLEWVERNDPRYQKYEDARRKHRHQRNLELNPGKPLPPGF